MSDRLDEFGDVDVVLITFTTPERVRTYAEREQLDYPIVVDTDRVAYGAFGLERGSVLRVWGLRSAKKYVEIIKERGFGPLVSRRGATDDTLQLGGDFIVDPNGTLIYGFWQDGPDERPSVEELLRSLP